MNRALAAAIGLAALSPGPAAMAQICTASTTGLSFGSYDPFATTPASITGTVTVTCTAVLALSVSYSVQLDGGLAGSISARAMSAGLNRLRYQLYTSSARSVVWGDGTGGSGVISDGYGLVALATVSRNYTAYGLVPARQMAVPGAYADLVTVLVTY